MHLGCRKAYFETDDVLDQVLHVSSALSGGEREEVQRPCGTEPTCLFSAEELTIRLGKAFRDVESDPTFSLLPDCGMDWAEAEHPACEVFQQGRFDLGPFPRLR